MTPLIHEEVVALWEAAGADPAWWRKVKALPAATRHVLLSVADSRYAEGAEEAAKSRVLYVALEADLDPCAPEDAVRIGRLFDGPLHCPWPMDLIRRGFRHAADRETENRCGAIYAQELMRAGGSEEGAAIAQAILRRAAGTGSDGEGVALLLLQRAAWVNGRNVEAFLFAGEAVRWSETHGSVWRRVVAWQFRVESTLVVGDVTRARDALARLRERVEALPEDRLVRGRALAVATAGAVHLFSGDPLSAVAEVRAARRLLLSADPSADPDLDFDIEVDALRRLGRVREATERLEEARSRAVTPEQRVHVGALDAALCASTGRWAEVVRFLDDVRCAPPRSPSAGLRAMAIEHVLDSCPDDRVFNAVADAAVPLLVAATAARLVEVAVFDGDFPEISHGTPQDLASLAHLPDPLGRRRLRPWTDVRAALCTSPALLSFLRTADNLPVCCAKCGRVQTRRDGWLPLRSLLPHDDEQVSFVETCERCPLGRAR